MTLKFNSRDAEVVLENILRDLDDWKSSLDTRLLFQPAPERAKWRKIQKAAAEAADKLCDCLEEFGKLEKENWRKTMKPINELNPKLGDTVFIQNKTGDVTGIVTRLFATKCWVRVGDRTIKGIEFAEFVDEPPSLPPAPAPAPEPESEPQPEEEPEKIKSEPFEVINSSIKEFADKQATRYNTDGCNFVVRLKMTLRRCKDRSIFHGYVGSLVKREAVVSGAALISYFDHTGINSQIFDWDFSNNLALPGENPETGKVIARINPGDTITISACADGQRLKRIKIHEIVVPAAAPEPEPQPQPEPAAGSFASYSAAIIPIKLLPLDMDMQPDIKHISVREELTRLLSHKGIKSGELLKTWYEVRPQFHRGTFAPATREDLIRAIAKRVTIEAPEKMGALFRQWPHLVERWPMKLRGWMPWLSMRQMHIVAEISKFLPVQWEPSPGTPLSRQQFDYGFSLCQFNSDHSEDWICVDNGQVWRLAKMPFWIDERNGQALARLIKNAGEDWLQEVCESPETAPYANLAITLKDAGY